MVEASDQLSSDQRRTAIREALSAQPSKMTSQLARELKVPEIEVIAAMPSHRAAELDAGRWESLIRSFQQLGRVHVIATNQAVTLESFGEFGNFSHWGEYFNVQTKTLDLHIRGEMIARVFAVTKPGHLDGIETFSFQFYDRSGERGIKGLSYVWRLGAFA